MSYKPAQIAKTITAALTGAGTIAATVVQALSDGTIKPDEWSLIITVVVGAITTLIAVFYIPNKESDN